MENKIHMYAVRTENQADILDLLSDISHEAAIASYNARRVRGLFRAAGHSNAGKSGFHLLRLR